MRLLKNILYVFVGVVAVVIVGIGVMIYTGIRNSAEIEAESMPYVDTAVVAITKRWDFDELMSRFTPEARESIDTEGFEGIFDVARSALGPLVEYRGAKLLNWTSKTSARRGAVTIVKYSATARYQNGEAGFAVTLEKSGNTWMIRHFGVNSPTLTRGLTGRKS